MILLFLFLDSTIHGLKEKSNFSFLRFLTHNFQKNCFLKNGLISAEVVKVLQGMDIDPIKMHEIK